MEKINSSAAPVGADGQIQLASGAALGLRMWRDEEPTAAKAPSTRSYETVGYVVSGRAELHLDGSTIALEPGDSWTVPSGASHAYRILEPFTAIEATAPPAPAT